MFIAQNRSIMYRKKLFVNLIIIIKKIIFTFKIIIIKSSIKNIKIKIHFYNISYLCSQKFSVFNSKGVDQPVPR